MRGTEELINELNRLKIQIGFGRDPTVSVAEKRRREELIGEAVAVIKNLVETSYEKSSIN